MHFGASSFLPPTHSCLPPRDEFTYLILGGIGRGKAQCGTCQGAWYACAGSHGNWFTFPAGGPLPLVALQGAGGCNT